MILVDTSVLIDYFSNQKSRLNKVFDTIIENGIPFGITYFTYQELLQGVKNEKFYQSLKTHLDSFTFFELAEEIESYSNAASLYRLCRQNGITVRSTIDILIAQTAIEHSLFLFHNDRDFDHIASVEKKLKIFDYQGLKI